MTGEFKTDEALNAESMAINAVYSTDRNVLSDIYCMHAMLVDSHI